MFSTAQQEYIKALLPTYAKEGYKSYVIYSNTVVNSGISSSTYPDLYAVFSKSTISAQNAYVYDVPDDVIVVTVRSVNYSSYGSDNNDSRVTVKTVSDGYRLEIDKYEHVYTNAEFAGVALQPDYNLISGGETNVRLEAISFILLVSVILSLLGSLFRRIR